GFVGLVRAEVAWAPAACAGAMTVCFGAALWRNRGDKADEGGAGSGGWAALMAASLATGAVSVAHIGASAALEARRAVAFSGEPVAWVVADVARSGPYLGGLLSVAPEGLLLVVTAAALAVAARAEGARW